MSSPVRASALLLDIEGTTTSITFVKDVLFPYATENVEKFLETSWDEQRVQDAVEGMRQQAAKDVESKIEGAVPIPDKDASKADLVEAVAKNLKWLISIDNKSTHMKELSGFIWQRGYEDGKLKGHVYDDVQPALKLWKAAGLKIYIYSSGSVHAQKLLVKYSTAGDLQPLIDDYFDTNVGHKREVSSYKNILEKIASSAEDTIFFTDIVEEAAAATEAGIKAVLLSREGNAALSSEAKEKYQVVESFNGLEYISTSAKRKQETANDESSPPAKVAKTEESVKEVETTSEKLEPKADSAIAVEMETMQDSKMEIDINGTAAEEETKEEKAPEETKNEEVVKNAEKPSVPEEKTEMEVDQVEEAVKPAKDLQCDNGERLVETDIKLKESKTEDIIVSDKEKVPLNMETEEAGKEVPEVNDAEMTDAADASGKEKTDEETDKKENISEADIIKDVKDDVEKTVEAEIKKPEIEEEKETCPSVDKMPTDAEPNKEVVTPPTLDSVDENIADVPDVPAVDKEVIDEEKLNKLLSEEGAALEKECDEILSKVEQVTNIDNLNAKTNVEPEPKKQEATEITNGHQVSVDELVDTVSNVFEECIDKLEEILPEVPAETTEPAAAETVPSSEVVNNGKDSEDNKSTTDQKENNVEKADKETATNGKLETAPDTNGDTKVKSNGNSETVVAEKHEQNGQNSDHANDKTNGTTVTPPVAETNADQTTTEIKVKKLPTEETTIGEQQPQLVNT